MRISVSQKQNIRQMVLKIMLTGILSNKLLFNLHLLRFLVQYKGPLINSLDWSSKTSELHNGILKAVGFVVPDNYSLIHTHHIPHTSTRVHMCACTHTGTHTHTAAEHSGYWIFSHHPVQFTAHNLQCFENYILSMTKLELSDKLL